MIEQRRLDLHEPPHMHTSMAFVAAGEPLSRNSIEVVFLLVVAVLL